MRDNELTGNAETHNASSGPVKDDSSRRRTLRHETVGRAGMSCMEVDEPHERQTH